MFDFRTIMLLLFLSQNLCGQNDIFELARRGSVQEVQAVVEETPSVLNAKDQRGSTPLVLACYYNNIEVVSYLIPKVEDINGSTKDGSPLMASAVKGYNAISKLLIAAGADVNLQDANKTTALHYAVMFKNYDLVLMLLEAGANPNHKNNVWQSPKDYVIVQNDERMHKIFKIK
jgi:ankyrin repeat protein